MSIIVANLQDNGAVFRIFITLLMFSFGSPLYLLYTEEVTIFCEFIKKQAQCGQNVQFFF